MSLTILASQTVASARSPQPVTLRGVSRTFTTPTGPRTVLSGVDLELAAGEIVALIGPRRATVDILPAMNGQDSNCYATLGGRAC